MPLQGDRFASVITQGDALGYELLPFQGVKNLILYHTEEKTLANRKENYTREAAENFKGRIFVPDDLEVIEL